MKIKNKKTYVQKVLGAGLLATLLIPVSCKKSFLDVPPQGQQPVVEFWKTPEDAAKAVNAMYSNLRSWPQVAFAPIAVESVGSDDAEKGSTPSDASFFNKFDNYT